MRVTLPVGISLELADGWLDITDDLPAGTPFTLARADGHGAFQFSPAKYVRGVVPNAGEETLRAFLFDFGVKRGFGAPTDVRSTKDAVIVVGGSFDRSDFIRVWYASDGRNFVFASHTSAQRDPEELRDCEGMIASVSFPDA